MAAGGRGLRYRRWAKRFLTFAELPEEAAFRRSYTLYDRDELVGLLDPGLAAHVDDVLDGPPRACTRTTSSTTTSTGCAWPTPGCSCLGSTSPTPTARAWRPRREVRVPFVDPLVFRAAFSLPGQPKIRGRMQKVAAASDGGAGVAAATTIIDRPKASFGAPLRAWVTNDLGQLVDDVLLDGELVSAGFLRRAALRRMVADQRSGRRDQSKQLWQLLSMELWYRNASAPPASRAVSAAPTNARGKVDEAGRAELQVR